MSHKLSSATIAPQGPAWATRACTRERRCRAAPARQRPLGPRPTHRPLAHTQRTHTHARADRHCVAGRLSARHHTHTHRSSLSLSLSRGAFAWDGRAGEWTGWCARWTGVRGPTAAAARCARCRIAATPHAGPSLAGESERCGVGLPGQSGVRRTYFARLPPYSTRLPPTTDSVLPAQLRCSLVLPLLGGPLHYSAPCARRVTLLT